MYSKIKPRFAAGATTLLAVLLTFGALASSAWATSVSDLAVNVSPARAGAERVIDTYSFETTSAIPALTGYVRLKAPSAPSGTFSSSNYDYVITDASGASYSFFAEVNPEGLGSNVVDVHLPAEIAEGETVTVAAYGVSNPQFSSPSALFAVATSTDEEFAEQTLPISSQGTISGLSVVPTTQSASARGVIYKVSFRASDGLTSGTSAAGSFSDGGFILLRAQSGTTYDNSTARITDGSQSALVGVTVNPAGLGTNVAEIDPPANFKVSPGDTVQVTVFNVTNSSGPQPTAQFSVSTSSDVFQAKASAPIRPATAVGSATVIAKPQSTGATGAFYEVAFTATTALYATTEANGCFFEYACDYVRLKAPEGTVFPSQPSDYELTFGSVHDHPWYVQVDPEHTGESNLVNVHLPNGTGVSTGSTVHVKAWGVHNGPANPAAEFAISTSLDATPVKKPLPIGPATSISSLAVTSSNSEAGASAVHETASFKSTSLLPFDPSDGETSYVRLQAPKGTTFGTYFRVTDGPRHQTALAVVNPNEEGGNVALVHLPFEVPAGDTLELTTSSTGNPPSASSGTEFTVTTSSDATPAAQAFPITAPTSVSAVTAGLTPATARSSEAVAQVGFTTTHAIAGDPGEELHACDYYPSSVFPTGCPHIRLTAPKGTAFAPTINDYFITTGGTTQAAWDAIVDPEATGEANVVDVYLSPEGEIAAGVPVQISAFGVSEPNSPNAGAEVAVSSSGDPAPASAALPIGPATSIAKLAVASSSHLPGAEHTSITARFKAAGPLTDGALKPGECCGDAGYVRLTAPGTATFASGSGYSINGTPTSGEADPEGLGENVVDVQIPQGGAIGAGQQVEVVASTLANPPVPGAYEFGVSTSSDGLLKHDIYVVTSSSTPTDETAPSISGTAERGQTLSADPGHWTQGPTRYAYQWLRCEGGCSAITGATGATYDLTASDVGKTVKVQVTAGNAAGAGAPATSAPTGTVAPSPLVADASQTVYATEGVAATLDGSAGSPTEAITTYSWDYGDGATGSGAIVEHAYAHPGTYTATLHVGDGKSTAVDTTTVIVAAAPAHEAEVTVDGTGGSPLAGAEVLYVSPRTGQRTAAKTNGAGVAKLPALPEGTDTVSAQAAGYRPATGQLTMTPGGAQTTLQLEAGGVAISTLEYEDMSLAEVEAAGIDPLDPANHQVHRFKARITRTGQTPVDYTCFLNSAGEFSGSCPAPALPGGATARPVAFSLEGQPMIEWLVTETSASALSQLLDVDVVIQNLSDAGVTLKHGSAVLRLGQGLGLAPVAQAQPFTQPVADIPGGGSASASWVLRGAATGEFRLAAAYEGRLGALETPVAAVAKLKDPIHIWGSNALQLSVERDEGTAAAGVPYHVTVAAKNVSPVTLHDVELAVDPSGHTGFIYQPDEHYSDRIATVAPGETVRSHHYVLVPDGSTSPLFKPSAASVALAGDLSAASESLAVKPPSPYGIETRGDTPRRVHLRWEDVPGAEGYEVFSIPNLATPFAQTPDSVSPTAGGTPVAGVLPSNATDAYLPARRGVRDYAVSAIIGGQPTLDYRVLAAEPGAVPAGLPEIVRCVAAPGLHGAYTDNKCTKSSGTHSGAYERSAGPGSKEGVSGTFGAVKFEDATKLSIKCTAGTSTGTVDDAKQISAVYSFTGCSLSSPAAPCQTSGASAGEVRTVGLVGEVGIIKAGAKPSVGLRLGPASGSTLAQITCGAKTITLKGSVIATLTSIDKPATSFKIGYKGKKGTQTVERFEGAPKTTLSWSVNGSADGNVGMAASEVLKSEEPLEVVAVP